MDAEQAYMFRHAMVREAAYELQLPSARSRLHALAADALEALYGPPVECGSDLDSFAPCALDPFADEICEHLQAALSAKVSGVKKSAIRARQAKLLRRAAHHCVEQFRYVEAADRFERVAVEFRAQVADPSVDLIKAADAASRAFQTDRAVRLCRRALRLARTASNNVAVGRVMGALGRHLQQAGRGRRAVRVLDLAIKMQRKLDDEVGLMASTSSRGTLAMDGDDFATAQPLLEEALRLARKLGHLRREGTGLNNLAALHIEMKSADKALEILETALEFNTRHGNLRALGFTWTNIGSIHNAAERDAEAEAALIEALAIHKQIANFLHAGYVLNILGRICERTNRLRQAREYWLEAADCFAACGNAQFEGGTRCNAAIVLLTQGDVAEAKTEFARGIELARQASDFGLVERMTAKFDHAGKNVR